jgi:FdhE protein
MLWPHARIRRARNVELQERVAVARRETPESEAWLGLLEAALGESEDGATWEAAVPTPAAERPIKAPVLSHAQITVDGRAARGWVRRLLENTPRVNPRRIDGLALLEAAVCHDDARIDVQAAAGGADPHALRVVGQMAALPLLQACARGLASALPPTWWEGYCPLCGAWPVVAEYTGLERKRRLRCGRCGTGWAIPLLRCVFCDETEHDNLGYLAPEAGEQTRKIEVCHTCKGYLKGFTTVRALAPWAILLDDLTTVPLDVAALERGYRRPERPGYSLECRITERRGWGRLVEVGGGWWRLLRRGLHQPPAPPPSSTDLRRGEA